jgi:hypothetical protein
VTADNAGVEMCTYVCDNVQKAAGCSQCASAKKCITCDHEEVYKLVEADGFEAVCQALCTVPGTYNVIEGKGVPMGACNAGYCVGPTSLTCKPGGCREGYKHDADTMKCLPDTIPGNNKDGMASMTEFDIFRAQDGPIVFDSINMASAAGVLSYLAVEVIKDECIKENGESTQKRHYGIDRVYRYHVKMWNTPMVGNNPRKGRFFNFKNTDKGMCTAFTGSADYHGSFIPEGCQPLEDLPCKNMDCLMGSTTSNPMQYSYNEFGYSVGAQPRTVPPGPTRSEDKIKDYGDSGCWYSFPGQCPSMRWDFRKDNIGGNCSKLEPGGQYYPDINPTCKEPDGTPFCTFSIEQKDYVTLDYLNKEKTGCGHNDRDCIKENTCEGEANSGFWKYNEDRGQNLARLQMFKDAFPGGVQEPTDPMGPLGWCDGF